MNALQKAATYYLDDSQRAGRTLYQVAALFQVDVLQLQVEVSVRLGDAHCYL